MARPPDPNTKIELLRAAESVFVEVGLDRARVEDITALAGRSKGSFYLHFEGKEDAFRQLVETMLARLATMVERYQPEQQPCLPPAEHFARLIDHQVELFDFIWQNRGLMRLAFEGGKSAGYGYLIDEFAERARASMVRSLECGVTRGLYRADLDVQVTSLCISGAYDRVARQVVRAERRPDLRAWLESVQQVFMRGLLGPALAVKIDPLVKKERAKQ